MIDTIYMSCVLPKRRDTRSFYSMKDNKQIHWKDCCFTPHYDIENGRVKNYTSNLNNLKLIIANGKLHIKNSWNTFSKGSNHLDYCYTDIERTIELLKSKFGEIIMEGVITRLAYGIVINDNAESNFLNWLSYRGVKALPMQKGRKMYGTYFPLTDYKIKAYDKTFESKKNKGITTIKNLFRIEIEVKYMRHLKKNGISINNVADLLSFENLQLLANDLVNKYDKIIMKNNHDYLKLTLKEMKIVSVIEHVEIQESIRINSPRTYARYKKQYDELDKYKLHSTKLITREKILTKYKELLNN